MIIRYFLKKCQAIQEMLGTLAIVETQAMQEIMATTTPLQP